MAEEEVDSVMQQAERAGATVVKKPQKTFWGATQAASPTRMATCGRLPTILRCFRTTKLRHLERVTVRRLLG